MTLVLLAPRLIDALMKGLCLLAVSVNKYVTITITILFSITLQMITVCDHYSVGFNVDTSKSTYVFTNQFQNLAFTDKMNFRQHTPSSRISGHSRQLPLTTILVVIKFFGPRTTLP